MPIVEPEIMMTGSHSIDRCEEETARVLESVFFQLQQHRVNLGGIVLKPNMVVAGIDSRTRPSVSEVAESTLRCLGGVVPSEVPGIAFLSGGQTPQMATAHLQAINAKGVQPWQLTYSFGRALQTEALAAWAGRGNDTAAAQHAFEERLRLVTAARRGQYSQDMESPG